jgi:hypothetical protein
MCRPPVKIVCRNCDGRGAIPKIEAVLSEGLHFYERNSVGNQETTFTFAYRSLTYSSLRA